MKAPAPRYHLLAVYSLSSGLLILVFCSGFLYKENREVRRINRQLMVQNDSILSVNLELKNKLDSRGAWQGRTGMRLKAK